jgi:hypothetical protein|tara:strand:+ start:1742 stop:2596 length:855 start_codon:yes stop_codon:yes gene_type:complete
MAKFNLDEYELVEDRLKKFWKDNPEGRVNTDVVNASADGTMVIVKAELFINKDDNTPVSSGLAQETKGLGGFANNEAWLENAESSALGRALANWKYQGRKKPRPTKEEMKKVKVESKPIHKPTKQEQKKMEDIADSVLSVPSNNAEELNEILLGMEPDDRFRKQFKKEAYDKVVASGFDKDVNVWSETQVKDFIQEFADIKNDISGLVTEIGGDMADIPSGDWEKDAPSEKQLKIFNDCIAKATDEGDTELVKKAKDFLNGGKANKSNIFDWVDTGTWSLKDGS